MALTGQTCISQCETLSIWTKKYKLTSLSYCNAFKVEKLSKISVDLVILQLLFIRLRGPQNVSKEGISSSCNILN